MSKVLRVIGKCLKYALITLLGLIVVVNVYMAIAQQATGKQPTLFGLSYLAVTTGSMTPEIPVGAMVITKEQNSYKEEDIITFRQETSSVYVTHRIRRFDEAGMMVTKGDANNTEDKGSVPVERVLGKVVLIVPFIGDAISFIKSPAGIMILGVVILAIFFLPGSSSKKKKDSGDGDDDGDE